MDASLLGIARWPSRGPASSADSNRWDDVEQRDTSPLCTSQHCSSAKSAQRPAMSAPCFHSYTGTGQSNENMPSGAVRGGLLFRVWSGSPLQWRSYGREYLIFSVMPCISKRRPLSDAVGAAFVICSRDDPFVVPANNCHREAAEIPAS